MQKTDNLCHVFFLFGRLGYTCALLNTVKARRFNINKLSDNPMMDLFFSTFTITSPDLMGFARLTIMMK